MQHEEVRDWPLPFLSGVTGRETCAAKAPGSSLESNVEPLTDDGMSACPIRAPPGPIHATTGFGTSLPVPNVHFHVRSRTQRRRTTHVIIATFMTLALRPKPTFSSPFGTIPDQIN